MTKTIPKGYGLEGPRGFCLEGPSGKLYPETFSEDRDSCWGHSFVFLSDRAWMKPFWKEWDKSIKAAKKRKYNIVPVVLLKAKS